MFNVRTIGFNSKGAFVQHNGIGFFLHFYSKEVHRRRTDKSRYKFINWVVIEEQGGTNLLDLSVLHNDDFIRHGHGFHLVVGNVDHCRVQAEVKVGKFRPHLYAQFGVQVGKGLVKEEDLGVTDNGAAYRDTLSLTAGEGLRFAVQEFFNVQNTRRFVYALVNFGFWYFFNPEAERHVFID